MAFYRDHIFCTFANRLIVPEYPEKISENSTKVSAKVADKNCRNAGMDSARPVRETAQAS